MVPLTSTKGALGSSAGRGHHELGPPLAVVLPDDAPVGRHRVPVVGAVGGQLAGDAGRQVADHDLVVVPVGLLPDHQVPGQRDLLDRGEGITSEVGRLAGGRVVDAQRAPPVLDQIQARSPS